MPAQTLAVDVGTSSLKAVLYDAEANVLERVTRRYGYRTERPGWAEGDPETWWQALEEAVADLRDREDLRTVEAVSCTGQMHSAVLLDEEGEVIPPTILWLDRRASAETEELQDLLELPPYQLNSTYTLPKLLWLRRNEPEVLDRTETILWPKDYLRYRLTSEICTDLTEPGGAALLDWSTRTYTTERLALVGLESDVLPPIRGAAANGGTILPDVARSLGLSPEVRTVVGMGDVAALFGAAPLKEGRGICSLGSSSMVFAPFNKETHAHDPKHRLHVYPFGPYPLIGGVSSTTGAALVWVCELCEGRSFGSSVKDALAVDPGSEGVTFIPYLAGERNPYWNDEIRGGFYGLALAHTHAHLVRAVMEGVADSLRHFLDLYGELGIPITELALAGGGATTEGWPQIIADVCQRDVLIYAEEETVTRVLFALCQENLGRATLKEALTSTFETPDIVHCRDEFAEVYREGYEQYRSFAGFASEQAATS